MRSVPTNREKAISGDNRDGSFKNVTVVTGDFNDQSIEIDGDALQEGMEVLADVNYEDTKNNISGGSDVVY